MKIRRGFVSNSSSSSFIVVSKGNLPKPEVRTNEETGGVHYTYLDMDFYGEINYCRRDIQAITEVKDKIRFIKCIYALEKMYSKEEEYTTETLPEYLECLHKAGERLLDVCRRYGYVLNNDWPPIHFVRSDEKYDWETHEYVSRPVTYRPALDVYTEIGMGQEIVRMVEDESTDELERFLFDPKSFAVVGGDEYPREMAAVEWPLRQGVDYDYDFYTDNKPKKKWGTEEPDYYSNKSIPELDIDEDRWNDEYQANLPFNGKEGD